MYYIIANPKSCSGRGARLWALVRRSLLLKRIPFQASLTRFRGHAARLSADLTGSGWDPADTLVVIGGDGTLNEVLDGLNLSADVTLGYIPTGSGNDFARGAGISTDPQTALAHILSPALIRPIDVGVLRAGRRTERFAISAGIGFDAAICHEALSSPVKDALNRLHLGKLTYAAIAVRVLFTCPLAKLTLTLDGGRRLTCEKAYFAAVMNLPWEGGGLRFCPRARPDDGVLDVLVVSGVSRPKAALLLLSAFWGGHTRFRGCRLLRCKSVTISSSLPLPVHTDGESAGIQSQLSVSPARRRVNVIIS